MYAGVMKMTVKLVDDIPILFAMEITKDGLKRRKNKLTRFINRQTLDMLGSIRVP